jgi:hypothetical protein
MALLDMQGLEAARGSNAQDGEDGRSALSLLSTTCADSLLSVAVCE